MRITLDVSFSNIKDFLKEYGKTMKLEIPNNREDYETVLKGKALDKWKQSHLTQLPETKLSGIRHYTLALDVVKMEPSQDRLIEV